MMQVRRRMRCCGLVLILGIVACVDGSDPSPPVIPGAGDDGGDGGDRIDPGPPNAGFLFYRTDSSLHAVSPNDPTTIIDIESEAIGPSEWITTAEVMDDEATEIRETHFVYGQGRVVKIVDLSVDVPTPSVLFEAGGEVTEIEVDLDYAGPIDAFVYVGTEVESIAEESATEWTLVEVVDGEIAHSRPLVGEPMAAIYSADFTFRGWLGLQDESVVHVTRDGQIHVLGSAEKLNLRWDTTADPLVFLGVDDEVHAFDPVSGDFRALGVPAFGPGCATAHELFVPGAYSDDVEILGVAPDGAVRVVGHVSGSYVYSVRVVHERVVVSSVDFLFLQEGGIESLPVSGGDAVELLHFAYDIPFWVYWNGAGQLFAYAESAAYSVTMDGTERLVRFEAYWLGASYSRLRLADSPFFDLALLGDWDGPLESVSGVDGSLIAALGDAGAKPWSSNSLVPRTEQLLVVTDGSEYSLFYLDLARSDSAIRLADSPAELRVL